MALKQAEYACLRAAQKSQSGNGLSEKAACVKTQAVELQDRHHALRQV